MAFIIKGTVALLEYNIPHKPGLSGTRANIIELNVGGPWLIFKSYGIELLGSSAN